MKAKKVSEVYQIQVLNSVEYFLTPYRLLANNTAQVCNLE